MDNVLDNIDFAPKELIVSYILIDEQLVGYQKCMDENHVDLENDYMIGYVITI